MLVTFHVHSRVKVKFAFKTEIKATIKKSLFPNWIYQDYDEGKRV